MLEEIPRAMNVGSIKRKLSIIINIKTKVNFRFKMGQILFRCIKSKRCFKIFGSCHISNPVATKKSPMAESLCRTVKRSFVTPLPVG